MVLSFPYQNFFKTKNTEHFLLAEAKLSIIVFFTDNSQITIDSQKATGFKGFSIDLKPDLIPDEQLKPANVPVVKKTIAKIQANFLTGLTFDAKFYTILQIKQIFLCTATANNDNQHIEYVLTAAGWIDATGITKIANAATHPLLNLGDLSTNKIVINALIVDLTELWMQLHKDNDNYTVILKNLSQPAKVTFKVWGNLSGNAFIWYSIIPKHVENSEMIASHVFFSPSDYGEHQNKIDDKKYIVNNVDYFKTDGNTLFAYLLPPIDDTSIAALQHQMSAAKTPVDLKEKRNVVNFKLANDKKTITPQIWKIGAGFEKAFYGLNASKPQQIFLMPQDFGTEGTSMKGIQTLGPPQALKQITDTIIDVLLTNTKLIGKGKEPIVKKDKLILSCYSESGFDLWFAVLNNLKNLKAIIAIEPQNLNTLTNAYGMKAPIGKEVLPKMVQLKIPIFILGRHQKAKYKPENVDLKYLNLLPTDPAKIFHYPPDPASNDFVRYRVERIMDITKDPFVLEDEKKIMNDLAKKKPPVVGKDAYKKVFGPLSNKDSSSNNNLGIEAWYSHHFALTGGQIMNLPKGDIYNKVITYSTFFQEAVEKIG